jgi:formylglycine-generating enzyme required for sulfatase activity
MVVKRFLVLTLLVLLTVTNVGASARGLSVQLRASEAKGAPVAGEVRLYGESHALVIGIDAYTNGWPRLSNAVKDAKLVAAALRKKGFDVTLKTNLKSSQLKTVFEEFFVLKGEDPEARLFVWFAGHGHTVDGEGYLVPADAPRADQYESRFRLKALNMRRFGEFVRQAQSKHVFNVFDSCFAGTVFDTQRSLPPAAITRATTEPVRQFLTSGDADQEVSDDGTFRKLFIRALEGGERADANGDGYVTGSEIGMFLTDRVTNVTSARQTPRYGKLKDIDFDRGDFVFKLASVSRTRMTGRSSSVTPTPSVDRDALFWNSVKDSDDSEMFKEYIREFPGGGFSRLARLKIKKLKAKKKVAVVKVPISALSNPAAPTIGINPQRYKPGDTFKDCSKCPEMVVIPAGRFPMGSLKMKGGSDSKPIHRVTIPKPIAVGKYEVIQAEYSFVLGYNPSNIKANRNPVEQVSWDDAQKFVRKLSMKTGKKYSLLSEAVWEYAARSGTTTMYSWGNGSGRNNANCVGCSSYWENRGGFNGPAPVGSFRANAFGLYDMHGNVWEWVGDCWNDNYDSAPTNGKVWKNGLCSQRVLRGGSWNAGTSTMRSSTRGSGESGGRDSDIGFRVARDLE